MTAPAGRRELPETPKDEFFFDKWLTGATITFEALVFAALTALEDDAPPRQRKRKSHDLATHEALVTTVIANLAYPIIQTGTPVRIAVPLGKPKARVSRYDRPGLRSLPTVLRDLHTAGFLTLRPSTERGRVSTIEPTPWFYWLVREAKITFTDIARAPGEETIRLSRTEWDYPARVRHREWIDYTDTTATRRYREEMARINEHLAAADLAIQSAGAEHIDIFRRTLWRSFNLPPWVPRGTERFDLGGRLFGGWWMNLEHGDRPFIRIAGEPVADLDFRALFVRLAYARADLAPPPALDDLYQVGGFEEYREGIKKALSAMLFARKRLRVLPAKVKPLFPAGTKAAAVRSAILARHPLLADTFETGVGFSLMFTESQMLVAILLRLNAAGITALPMHDGIMVPASRADQATRVMQDVAEEQIGRRLPVKRT